MLDNFKNSSFGGDDVFREVMNFSIWIESTKDMNQIANDRINIYLGFVMLKNLKYSKF